jgi:tRNA (mo5U34)-methyltransferase
VALTENSGRALNEPSSAGRHAPLEPSEILRRVQSMRWVHSIDLGHGIVTPGAWGPPRPVIRRAFDAIDFRGKKVLDIGCWDGGWSFEAERRGAACVFATDYLCQRHSTDQQTFQLAHRVLNSRVRYHPHLSVYDVAQLGMFDFDVVIFCGVYYHLRHPLLAIARLRQVMKDGAMIVVEGAAIHGPRDAYSNFYYRRSHVGDPSNWCIPTIPCLREWIESSFFDDVVEHRVRAADFATRRAAARWTIGRLLRRPRVSRVAMTARAVRRKDPKYLYPDDDFKAFDMNDYR